MPANPDKEKEFFDKIASDSLPSEMSSEILNRYVSPRWPHLFGKEMMFNLAGDLRGKKVLEMGCGEGVASVQLAYCGAIVDAVDISPVSIQVARKRAELNNQSVNFIVGDVTKEVNFEINSYDIVWCDLILHHLVDHLESVSDFIYACLKEGGLFVAREPVAYANWLKKVRAWVPVHTEATEDEQPLRETDFQIIRQRFPLLHQRYFRILARADKFCKNLNMLRFLARIDNAILMLPKSTSLAGNVVVWSKKIQQ